MLRKKATILEKEVKVVENSKPKIDETVEKKKLNAQI